MKNEWQRKGNNALGALIIILVLLLETLFADHKAPNPASPYVWSVLGLAAAVSLVLLIRYRRRDAVFRRQQTSVAESGNGSATANFS
jgi:hypothetical protein